MTQATRIVYGTPRTHACGMVVEEVAPAATDGAARWPFRAARFEVTPGSTTELDVHDVAELWFVRCGRGSVRSGDTVLDVSPGEMVFFASRVPHQITNTGVDELCMFSVWWNGPGVSERSEAAA